MTVVQALRKIFRLFVLHVVFFRIIAANGANFNFSRCRNFLVYSSGFQPGVRGPSSCPRMILREPQVLKGP